MAGNCSSRQSRMCHVCSKILRCFFFLFLFRILSELELTLFNQIRYHTCSNFILILIARAISNFSKNDTFLMSRIWKMGRNLFSSLAIKDNLKVAYLEKNSSNPKICLVTGSGFFELSILCNCTSVWGTGCVRKLSWDLWASLLVNLALANCVELRCVFEIFVAYCTCSLSLPLCRIDTSLFIVVTKWSSRFKKTLLS